MRIEDTEELSYEGRILKSVWCLTRSQWSYWITAVICGGSSGHYTDIRALNSTTFMPRLWHMRNATVSTQDGVNTCQPLSVYCHTSTKTLSKSVRFVLSIQVTMHIIVLNDGFSYSRPGQRRDAVWSPDNTQDSYCRGEADCPLQTVWGETVLHWISDLVCNMKDNEIKM